MRSLTRRLLSCCLAVLACLLAAPLVVPLLAQDPDAGGSKLLEFLTPILVVAVPLLTSSGYQLAKKYWLKRLDDFPPKVQQALVTIGTAVVGAFAAYIGAQLPDGMNPTALEAVTIIVMQVLASFGVYNVAMAPPSVHRR